MIYSKEFKLNAKTIDRVAEGQKIKVDQSIAALDLFEKYIE